LCGQVDALLALAVGAEKYNWSRPGMTDSGGISIQEGRHPLQELVVPCFIPNDCHLSDRTEVHDVNSEISPALLLTGPNHSGKSVYLKQTATIIYLAQIGSYVPAKSAVLGLTDKIFTRLSTRESVSHMESAFAIELKQVAQALKGATPRSLVLIDEFGKGTSPDDGAGMLTALIDHFLAAGQDCPRLMIATHFHEIFEGGYLNHRPHLRVAHLEVEIDQNNQQAEDHLTYLFKLAKGHSSSSFGCRCAALNGVPSAVIGRAEAVSSMIARHEDLVTACSQLSSREEEHLERAEAVARHFLAIDPDTLMQGSLTETGERHRKGSTMRLLNDVLGSDSE
jgi:DNA mismatch repair protein MSH5